VRSATKRGQPTHSSAAKLDVIDAAPVAAARSSQLTEAAFDGVAPLVTFAIEGEQAACGPSAVAGGSCPATG